MKTPLERYQQDPAYARLVDVMEAWISQAMLTPSEIREAAIFACIKYEMRHGFRQYTVPLPVNDALRVMEEWMKKEKDELKCINCVRVSQCEYNGKANGPCERYTERITG